MRAYVTNSSSLLGASLTGALNWEGHSVIHSVLEADVVFDTERGVIYRRDRPLARFVFAEILGPGDVQGTTIGDGIIQYVRSGYMPSAEAGACVTDARDIALAMLASAERGISGEFEVVGPYITFEDVRDMLSGAAQARTSVALPELGITFRPVEETIADVIAWERLRTNSMVA
jgi:hypothetical protein